MRNQNGHSSDNNGDGTLLDAAIATIRTTTVPVDAVSRLSGFALRLRPEVLSQAREPQPADGVVRRGSRRAIAIVTGLAVACILACFAPGAITHRRASAEFAEVVKRTQEASTVRFTVTMNFGDFGSFKALQWMAGKRFRYEPIDRSIVQIVDLELRKQLKLDTSNKLAHVSRIPLTEEQGLELLNPVQALAGCAEHGVQAVPGKPDTFQGKQGSSVIGLSSNSDLLVTVDPTSGLPTQITIVDPNREHGWEVMLDDFHWNVPIDGAFLSLEPPQGYELTSDPIFGGPPNAPNASTATDEP